MAISNTNILIKRSTSTDNPGALRAGEFAYSYTANTLYLGTSDGLSSVNVGGHLYTSTIDAATNLSTPSTLVKRDGSGNASFNTIYGSLGTASGVTAGQYGDVTHVPVITVTANGIVTNVHTTVISTTLSFNDDKGDFGSVNLLTDSLDFRGQKGIVTDASSNTVILTTDDTVVRSNTLSVGPQVIETDLAITGNLIVYGNTTTFNTETLNVVDPMIYLASNNYSSDIVNIGFAANYFDGVDERHTGFFRDHHTKEYYLFDNYIPELSGNNEIDLQDSSFRLTRLHANVVSANISVTEVIKVESGANAIFDGVSTFNSNTIFNDAASFYDGIVTHGCDINISDGHNLALNNVDNTNSSYIYNNGSSGSNYLKVSSDLHLNQTIYVDNLRLDSSNTLYVTFFNANTKEITYSTLDTLMPSHLANGAYLWTATNTGNLILPSGAAISDLHSSVVFGNGVDTTNVNTNRVSIGNNAGQTSQQANTVAIGTNAGNSTQGNSGVAIGYNAASSGQGAEAVAIGKNAGYSQGAGSVVIGSGAGDTIGSNSIAIGNLASASSGFTPSNAIVLNATGSDFSPTNSGLYINPVRYTAAQDSNYDGVMFYNSSTKEIRYSYALDGGSF